VPTGLRQTTVTFPAGSIACFFTDGLIEARVAGELLGSDRLAEMVAALRDDDAPAPALVARLAKETDELSDDVAAFVIRAEAGAPSTLLRVEELELGAADVSGGRAERFLVACGLDGPDLAVALEELRATALPGGSMTLRVGIDDSGEHSVAAAPRGEPEDVVMHAPAFVPAAGRA
jgi:hypothetical protein